MGKAKWIAALVIVGAVALLIYVGALNVGFDVCKVPVLQNTAGAHCNLTAG